MAALAEAAALALFRFLIAMDNTIIIPGLPNEMAMTCLAMMPRGLRPLARLVCRSWNEFLKPANVEALRQQLGVSETRVFFYFNDSQKPGYSTTNRSLDRYCSDYYNTSWMMLDTVLWSCVDLPFHPANFSPQANHMSRFNPKASCWIDNYLYEAGGFHEDEALRHGLNFTRRCRTATRTLHLPDGKCETEVLKDMALARAYSAGVAFQGRFYAIGGILSEEINDVELHGSCEFWDPFTREWTLIPNMWPLHLFGSPKCPMVTVLDEQLYALRAQHSPVELLRYEMCTNGWISLGHIPSELCSPDHRELCVDREPQNIAQLLAVGKELWIVMQCPINQLFALATFVPTSINCTLKWRWIPFPFRNSTSFVSAVAVNL